MYLCIGNEIVDTQEHHLSVGVHYVISKALIRSTSLNAQGSFAEAQASFLTPDSDAIAELNALLKEKNVGVVAHFYMDAELRGFSQLYPSTHIFVADSLLMADHAVTIAEAGVSKYHRFGC